MAAITGIGTSELRQLEMGKPISANGHKPFSLSNIVCVHASCTNSASCSLSPYRGERPAVVYKPRIALQDTMVYCLDCAPNITSEMVVVPGDEDDNG